MSLVLMDRHYATFNDKFITAINQRKERINEVIGRIKTVGEKISKLDSVKKRMIVSASKKYPFK